MSRKPYHRAVVYRDKEHILNELEEINFNEINSIYNDEHEYLLINKIISFADVVTGGKLGYQNETKNDKKSFSKAVIKERNKKNLLFYVENSEMEKFEFNHRKEKVLFCQTKQSSIHVPKEFYEFTNNGSPRNYKFKKYYKGTGFNVLLVNKFVEGFFDKLTTNKLLRSYGRDEKAYDVPLSEGLYTPCDFSVTQHGLGLNEEKDLFRALRKNIFAKDSLYILIDKENDNKFTIYLIPYRNTQFYKQLKMDIPIHATCIFDPTTNVKVESRKQQNKWRRMLASQFISKSLDDSDIITCPLTGVEVEYPNEFTIMRASHIKEYSKCKDEKEAYDLDNGLLLSANADALFDKHLITINPKTLRIERNNKISKKLKDSINLKNSVDSKYINDNTRKYLEFHYDEFLKLKK